MHPNAGATDSLTFTVFTISVEEISISPLGAGNQTAGSQRHTLPIVGTLQLI